MDEYPDQSTGADADEKRRSEQAPSFIDEYDEKPRQDPVSSAVNQYLNLVNHSLQSSQLSSNRGNAIFKDVKVWAGDSGSEFLDTVTNIFLAPVALFRKILSAKKPLEKNLLHGINGVVQEGEMLLVLGRPGSGCTTLLKTLSGFTETFHGWSGEITYDGLPIATMKKDHRGNLVYNAEGDVHFPTLPVLSTLTFAAQTKVSAGGLTHSDRRQKVGTVTETLFKVFGLEGTETTMVGNAFIQGVSGGERKRVSLAEVLSTNAKISYWDNSTLGLDATTSVRFGRALRTYVTSGRKIAAAALYQASDELVNMFDKITLMHDGRQIFFGTIDEAQQYLYSLGFVWSNRQSLGEFFVSATDPEERVTKEGWENRVPRTVEDWDRCWKESLYFQKLQKEIDTQLGAVAYRVTPPKTSRKESPYVLSGLAQFTTTLQRAFLRLRGDKPFLGSSIVGPTFIALIVGSCFYNSANTTNGFFSRQGVLFFSLLFNTVQTLVEISSQFAQRPIVEKQTGFAMYHGGIDAIASLVSLFPLKLLGVSFFSIVIYFLANLKREVGAFFTFVLFTYTTVLIMASLFRLIGALNKHETIATSIGGLFILPSMVYTGYFIPKPSMHPWFKWITYINPLSYAFESLMANEFHGRLVPCSNPVPSGPAYPHISPANQVCPVTGSVAGSIFVSGDRYIEASFEYTHAHLWRNFGILVGFFLALSITYGIVVEFVPQIEKGKGDVLIFLRRYQHPASPDTGEETALASRRDSRLKLDGDTDSSNSQTVSKKRQGFTWNKIDYQIPVKDGSKALLTDISGFVKPGTMTALMGESGAGKTTLLNVLAQRTHMGTVNGSILMNGQPQDDTFARRTGYVESQDVHLSEFSVRETLRFSARLRQPQSVSDEMKLQYVEDVIEMLDMGEFADAIVGVPGSGLSLEQRKRMTVGVELVAKPSMLFLDEPTSGLDSQSSFAIVKCLRKLADAGLAILCTIHQPSGSLFEQFDRLLLLQKGGRCVYFGDIGVHSKDVIGYLECNGATKCPARANPAEYLLTATEIRDGQDWATIWQNSAGYSSVQREIAALSQAALSQAAVNGDALSNSTDRTSFLQQYQLVQRRSLQWHWRSPTYIRGKIILNLVAALFLGFTFYQQKNSAQGLQNKLFATFSSIVQSVPLMNQLQPRFFAARALYTSREEPARMYHWSIFVISAVVTEILINLISGTLFFLPWYFIIGFGKGVAESAYRGIYEWIIFLMFEVWVSTFGQVLAAVAPSEQTARLFIPMIFIFVALFCGVLQPYRLLPEFWRWVHFAVPFTWLLGGMLSNVLHTVTVTCTKSEISIFQPPTNSTCGAFIAPFLAYGPGTIYNPSATSNCEYCRFDQGDQYLGTLNVGWHGRWRDYGVLWAYVMFNIAVLLVVTGLPRLLKAKKARKAAGKVGEVVEKSG